jgi:hypothetical protein
LNSLQRRQNRALPDTAIHVPRGCNDGCASQGLRESEDRQNRRIRIIARAYDVRRLSSSCTSRIAAAVVLGDRPPRSIPTEAQQSRCPSSRIPQPAPFRNTYRLKIHLPTGEPVRRGARSRSCIGFSDSPRYLSFCSANALSSVAFRRASFATAASSASRSFTLAAAALDEVRGHVGPTNRK